MTVRPPVSTVPAVALLVALLVAPAVGSAPQWGFQGQQTGRGVQTPPPSQGRGQAPQTTPGAPSQQGPRQPPTAEQFLGRSQWWKDEAVKKEMKLTETQARQIGQIFDGRVRYITPWFEDYTKQLEALDRMVRERTVDVTTYEIQVNRVEALRSRLNETRQVMLYRIYKMLDPAQYQSLQDIRDRGGRGRGGAPGPR